jgi:DNA-directed RNA polymerase specialized sigma24 family protein
MEQMTMNMMTAQTSKTNKTIEDMIASAVYAHRGMIANVARRHGLDEDAADDLIQEVVIYIISYHRQYGLDLSAPSKFNSLVRGSAIQRALNVCRRKRVRFNDEFQLAEGFEAMCHEDLPDQVVEAEDRLERAFKATGDTWHSRHIKMLLEGHNAWHIADLCGISRNTSAGRTKRIRIVLEKEFRND